MYRNFDLSPLDLSSFSGPELVDHILRSARDRQGRVYTYATADTVLRASTNARFRCAMERASIRFADGMGAVIHSRVIFGRQITKNSTHDFFASLVNRAVSEGMNIAFVGGRGDTTSRARDLLIAEAQRMPENGEDPFKTSTQYRNQIHCRNGYFQDPLEEDSYLAEIDRLNPSLIVVGMGQPIQELWADRVRLRRPETTFLCVGGLFDLVANNLPTPPRWIRRSGLEWSFRLATNPRHTWRRYLLGLPTLALISCVQVLHQSLGSEDRGSGR